MLGVLYMDRLCVLDICGGGVNYRFDSDVHMHEKVYDIDENR